MSDPLIAGRMDGLAPGIRRLVAPNPGMMTGPGTNTYLIGREAVRRSFLVDPGRSYLGGRPPADVRLRNRRRS